MAAGVPQKKLPYLSLVGPKWKYFTNLDGIISGVLIKLVGGVANVAMDVYQPCLNRIIFFIRKNRKSFPHLEPIAWSNQGTSSYNEPSYLSDTDVVLVNALVDA